MEVAEVVGAPGAGEGRGLARAGHHRLGQRGFLRDRARHTAPRSRARISAEGSRARCPSSARAQYPGCVTAGGRGSSWAPPPSCSGPARLRGRRARPLLRRDRARPGGGEAAGFPRTTPSGRRAPARLRAIRDEIRPHRGRDHALLPRLGVELRASSGRRPAHGLAIAARAGVPLAERYVDATTLDTPREASTPPGRGARLRPRDPAAEARARRRAPPARTYRSP